MGAGEGGEGIGGRYRESGEEGREREVEERAHGRTARQSVPS